MALTCTQAFMMFYTISTFIFLSAHVGGCLRFILNMYNPLSPNTAVFLSAFLISSPWAADFDVFRYVNPLIGTNNGGNVFAGATLPYGMAKAVADVDGQNTGGFSTDGSNVTGFSAMHDSGTGGNPSLGNFPLFPQYCPEDKLDSCKFPIAARATHYINDSIVATPGYFALTLNNGIHAEMTAAQHTALFHFNFPAKHGSNGSALSPLVLLDLTDLWASWQNASISVDGLIGRIKGNGTFLPSFGAGSYVSHFRIDFSGATIRDSGVWVNDRAGTEPKDLFVTRGFNLLYIEAGGFVRFEGPVSGNLSARVGMSSDGNNQIIIITDPDSD